MKRTSKIWKPTREQFRKLVDTSKSAAQVLRALGLRAAGRNHQRLYKRISEEKLEISHWVGGPGHPPKNRAIPLEKVMVEDSPYSRTSLKKRLIKEGVIPYRCSICSCPPEWEWGPLVLVLDHINGVYNDNRKENLRFLCPNCNSQTRTFAGRKLKIHYHCKTCGRKISRGSMQCKPCAGTASSKPKINWPSAEELVRRVEDSSCLAVARELGVSDNAIRKRILKHPQGEKLISRILEKTKCCPDCGKKIPNRNLRCKPCSIKSRPKKVSWPEINNLQKMVSETSYEEVAEKLGVMERTVKRKLKKFL